MPALPSFSRSVLLLTFTLGCAKSQIKDAGNGDSTDSDSIDSGCCGSEGDSGPVSLADADAELLGEADDDAGFSVAGARDVNGDGALDVIVGVPGASAAVVWPGPLADGVHMLSAGVVLSGSGRDDAGFSVAGPGDVNGDGIDDLLVGAPQAEHGAACVVLGPLTASMNLASSEAALVGEDADSGAGWSVAGAGDVDGDGVDDMLVGAPAKDSSGPDPGSATVVLGPVSGDVALASGGVTLGGEAAGDRAGWSVASAGDVNGDGLSDVLVGAPLQLTHNSEAGAAYLVLGPSVDSSNLADADAKLRGETTGDWAGASVASAGDMDGDGSDDLLVGASLGNAAYLVLSPATGNVSLADAQAKLVGHYTAAGTAVAGPGDLNGDDRPDLLIGAPAAVFHGVVCGAAYVVLGPVSGTLELTDADTAFVGEDPSAEAGISVAGAGDMDGDGVEDVLIGSDEQRQGGPGRAYLLHGGAR